MGVSLQKSDGTMLSTNTWTSQVYPMWVDTPSPAGMAVVVQTPEMLSGCPFSNCVVLPGTGGPASLTKGQVHLTTTMTDRYLEIAEGGGVVVLLQSQSKGPYPSEKVRFKQAWWLGSAVDNTAGTVFYPEAKNVFGNMAPGGFCDQTWFRLIENAQAFLIEEMALANQKRVQTLVRAIDISTFSRNKALVFKLPVGKGVVIGVGLNVWQEHLAGCAMEPEKAWALSAIIRYAMTLAPVASVEAYV